MRYITDHLGGLLKTGKAKRRINLGYPLEEELGEIGLFRTGAKGEKGI